MATLILPDDLPSDPTTEQSPLFKKLAEHYTKIITERVELHGIVRRCLDALGNGSGATEVASIDFLQNAPQEVGLVIADAKAREKALRDALQNLMNRTDPECVEYQDAEQVLTATAN